MRRHLAGALIILSFGCARSDDESPQISTEEYSSEPDSFERMSFDTLSQPTVVPATDSATASTTTDSVAPPDEADSTHGTLPVARPPKEEDEKL